MTGTLVATTLALSTIGFAGIGFDFKMPDINFGSVDEIVKTYNAQLFEDERDVEKEVINSTGIDSIKLDSIYGALDIEVSPDADIHLAYPSVANFKLKHEVTDGVLNITSEVDTPGNSDVLKVYIPSGTVERLDVMGGTSMIHFIGKEEFLTTCNIDVTLATVVLENISANTTVKTTSGTIRLKNETVRSNISLKSQYGVVDVELGELPDDVSIYTTGRAVSNTLLGARAAISPNEKYAVRLENSVGGINIHG